MKQYVVIKDNPPYDGQYQVVGVHHGASSWTTTLELQKVLNIEETIAWEISEAAANLVYAHRSAHSNIDSARNKLTKAIKEFMP